MAAMAVAKGLCAYEEELPEVPSSGRSRNREAEWTATPWKVSSVGSLTMKVSLRKVDTLLTAAACRKGRENEMMRSPGRQERQEEGRGESVQLLSISVMSLVWRPKVLVSFPNDCETVMRPPVDERVAVSRPLVRMVCAAAAWSRATRTTRAKMAEPRVFMLMNLEELKGIWCARVFQSRALSRSSVD
jgi:hypothetical protein